MKARLINVILVEDGIDRKYFTIEGVEIGSFYGARQQAPEKELEAEGPKSAITKSPSPEKVRRDQEIQNDEASKVENRYPGVVHGKRKED